MSLDDAEKLGLLNCCSVSAFATNCSPGRIAYTLSLDFSMCEMGPVPHSGLPRLPVKYLRGASCGVCI